MVKRNIRELSSHPLVHVVEEELECVETSNPLSTNETPNPDEFDAFSKRERSRFIAAEKGDVEKAMRRLHSAAPFRCVRAECAYQLAFWKWRVIKSLYVHKFVRGRKENVVLIDNVGSFNRSLKNFKREGITDDDVIEHAIFLMTYFLSHVDTREYPHGRIIRVFDLSGFKLRHVSNIRALRLGLRLTFLAEKYFPERLAEIHVINAHPFAIGVYNRLVRGLLHERTRNKFSFHQDDAVLRDLLRPEQLDWANYTSPDEAALDEFVRHNTAHARGQK